MAPLVEVLVLNPSTSMGHAHDVMLVFARKR